MFYKTKLKDYIRLPPAKFGEDLSQAITEEIKHKYEGYISKEIGFVIDVSSIDEIMDGVIIPGDGAPYYAVVFTLITFKPELHEIVLGKIKDIADFGAFFSMGPVEGMVHVSQTMTDFVSFSKDKVLLGKETKRSLKIGDLCLGKIIAISYKDLANPKIGLTMRQPGLGKLEWIEEDLQKAKSKKGKARAK